MRALVLASLLIAGACTSNFPVADPAGESADQSTHSEGALLLVSLADGQLVMQHVDIDAEFCMKQNEDPATRCFRRGEAIIDPASNNIIAYQLETREIDLYAHSP